MNSTPNALGNLSMNQTLYRVSGFIRTVVTMSFILSNLIKLPGLLYTNFVNYSEFP